MNIHEYQAKGVLSKFGVAILRGKVIADISDARKVAEEIGGDMWVVKAQIHAGGRGKGGGVKLAKSLDEVEKYAKDILGMNLVTHQTGSEGKIVKKVLIVEAADISKEYYLGIVLDREKEIPVMMASTEGGVEIEKVAEETPEKIIKIEIDPTIGMQDFQARLLAFKLGFKNEQVKYFIKLAKSLYNAYINTDSSLVEINPMALLDNGSIIALDAKMGFDSNALFRHKDILEMRDFDEEDPVEVEASKHGLSYVNLDGNVGCMVNGAGLAMSTMDIIKHEGGEPANFLDVGGKANAETVAKGFEIILKDKNVKSIFINIFGGIVRCDRIAKGIIKAAKDISINVPIIVRLDGTNAEEAIEILNKSDIDMLISATDLADGAKKAV
ncbi:MAG: ADP-forming succinate--CoA ligase subunit beta, partial [Candidatus Marinimicrobia bacterium]|nr:ADP-forming succinate--CoA ligase subunit beta [Candidatus Neomarinimicrobiota bacterium]